jgi:acetyltransferase-like isoleucine patch superfamily enzyme
MSNKNYKPINLTSLGVNDESATLVEWLYDDADEVKKEDILAIVETTKATFDIPSESNGYLIKLKKVGEEVTISDPIALIIHNKDELENIKKNYFEEKLKRKTDAVKITKKANELADVYNIDISELESWDKKVIRAKDIQAQINIYKSKSDSGEKFSLIGKVDEDFLHQLEKDTDFPSLSSDEKIKRYRANGAVIEDGVEIGSESIILAKYIHLKRGSKIGSKCYIKASSFELGVMSVFGNNANVVTRHIKIGDVFFSGNSVTIGGGGAFSSKARLIIGDECLVSSNCLLNTGEGIIIGNRVGLSPHVKLYTHSHWQNELEGYRSNFGPIIIEDNVYITGDCLIVPNVIIGEGSTIFANSTVTKNVEPYTQLSGNPAVAVGKIKTNLSTRRKKSTIKKILENMYQEIQKVDINENEVVYYDRIDEKTKIKGKVLITLSVDENFKLPKQTVLFDLNKYEIKGKQNTLTDEVRNYFRRRGIRFKPIHWRYSADKGLYND